jgi:CelD/BcsL family acetyltransferase involved in cellulose biosynthesis
VVNEYVFSVICGILLSLGRLILLANRAVRPRLRLPPVSRLEPIADLATARALWTDLAERSGNIFATWEWADAWWRRFGSGGELALYSCLRDDEPFAIAPLYREHKGPVGLLRFIGHGVGDVLGPVCAPADARLAVETIAAGLRGNGSRWTALLAERLPGEQAVALGGELLLSEANPSLAIDGRTWDDFLAGSSKNMREKVKRNTRKLERDHELRFDLCGREDEVEPMMRTLFSLHGMRWGEEGGSFGRESVTPFHLDFAPIALARGWLRLWTMRVDGEPAAAWYGFRFGDVEAYYQSGRDPKFDRFSVGFLMLARTIKGAFDDGLGSYGFLRGDESYKDRFATSTGTLETRAVGNGVTGRGAVRTGALALRNATLRDRIVAAIR